ncbi:MAG TPA: isoprenyl transferase [bacterium]|nr:isoprenyl transferase [bacterium]
MTEIFLKDNGLLKERLPQHVAIIMDGNGRWAKKRLMNRLKGHREGADSVDRITSFCRKAGVEYLTLYAFSTENWNRPDEEVAGLMEMLREFLHKKRKTMLENNIRFNVIGDMSRFPSDILKTISNICKETAANDPQMTLTLALSYGSRFEIVSAVKKIVQNVVSGNIDPSKIDEKMFRDSLFTWDIPDPDLVIRTSGEKRLSNYLLWQSAYSEFYFTDVFWPDFKEPEFIKALLDYASRERRFGKTAEQIKKR